MRDLGADVVPPRGTGFAELVRKEVPDGVDGLLDTAGVAAHAIRAVRDGGRVAASAHGTEGTRERGITARNTFVPQYAREHVKPDRLHRLAEEGRLAPRGARALPAEQAPRHTGCGRRAASGDGSYSPSEPSG